MSPIDARTRPGPPDTSSIPTGPGVPPERGSRPAAVLGDLRAALAAALAAGRGRSRPGGTRSPGLRLVGASPHLTRSARRLASFAASGGSGDAGSLARRWWRAGARRARAASTPRLVAAGALVALVPLTLTPVIGPGEATSVPVGPGTSRVAGTPGLGRPVTDGRFEFTVRRVERHEAVGEAPFEARARGEYVLVYTDVKNIGERDAMLDAANQRLVDTQGGAHASTFAVGRLPDADRLFLERIGPGVRIAQVPILFDVPAGTPLDHVELRDSVLSGGALVSLR